MVEKGPPIEGMTHRGKPVPAWLSYPDGRKGIFNRIARTNRQGRVNLSQLRKDEFVVAPGLIYRDTPAVEAARDE